jgi:hypothetical protein
VTALIQSLRSQAILLPSIDVIERICSEAITRATRRIHVLLTESLTDAHRRQLDDNPRDNSQSEHHDLAAAVTWRTDLPPIMRNQIEHFFRHYKSPKGQMGKGPAMDGSRRRLRLIRRAISPLSYNLILPGSLSRSPSSKTGEGCAHQSSLHNGDAVVRKAEFAALFSRLPHSLLVRFAEIMSSAAKCFCLKHVIGLQWNYKLIVCFARYVELVSEVTCEDY